MSTYKKVNGTCYSQNTPDGVIYWLEHARKNNLRVRVFYGDDAGRDWMEIYDTIGTVGRSTGICKIPILLKSKNSHGGSAILDDCIVKITIDKEVVYQSPLYHTPKLEVVNSTESLKKKGYYFTINADGREILNCETLQKAQNCIAFFEGRRNKIA